VTPILDAVEWVCTINEPNMIAIMHTVRTIPPSSEILEAGRLRWLFLVGSRQFPSGPMKSSARSAGRALGERRPSAKFVAEGRDQGAAGANLAAFS
jgi:hypothetical protein